MKQAVQLLVREHKSNYNDLPELAKETTKKVITEFFVSLIGPTRVMTESAAEAYVARATKALHSRGDIMDIILQIVVSAFRSPREMILVHIQRISAVFNLIRLSMSNG